MNVIEKIEANADLTLWCVHILGPDDLLAAPSYAAATAHARALNAALHGRENAPDDILCCAYAAPWPYSRETHAEDVKKWEAETRPKVDLDPHLSPTTLDDEVNELIARLSAPGRVYTHTHAAQIMQTLLNDHRMMRGLLGAHCAKTVNSEQYIVMAEECARLKVVQAQFREAMREASNLANWLWSNHFKEAAPNFELLDTPAGILSQIDNMLAGLKLTRADLSPRREAVAVKPLVWEKCETYTFTAWTEFGNYNIDRDGDGWWAFMHECHGDAFEESIEDAHVSDYEIVETLKAAAQSDYQRRYNDMSALTPLDTPVWRTMDDPALEQIKKDGVDILLRVGDLTPTVGKWENGRWDTFDEARFAYGLSHYPDGYNYTPTSWMHLPNEQTGNPVAEAARLLLEWSSRTAEHDVWEAAQDAMDKPGIIDASDVFEAVLSSLTQGGGK